MKKLIYHLRRQPEEHRRGILHILTIIFALVLFVLWTWNFGTSLAGPETGTKLKEDLKPFSVLKDNIIDGYKSISE